jgi:hypothetical protein
MTVALWLNIDLPHAVHWGVQAAAGGCVNRLSVGLGASESHRLSRVWIRRLDSALSLAFPTPAGWQERAPSERRVDANRVTPARFVRLRPFVLVTPSNSPSKPL